MGGWGLGRGEGHGNTVQHTAHRQQQLRQQCAMKQEQDHHDHHHHYHHTDGNLFMHFHYLGSTHV